MLEDALDSLAQGRDVAQRGITVVAPAWLEQCVREGRFVPPEADARPSTGEIGCQIPIRNSMY